MLLLKKFSHHESPAPDKGEVTCYELIAYPLNDNNRLAKVRIFLKLANFSFPFLNNALLVNPHVYTLLYLAAVERQPFNNR